MTTHAQAAVSSKESMASSSGPMDSADSTESTTSHYNSMFRPSGRKRALLIGHGDKNWSNREPNSRDVVAMTGYLESLGFRPEDIMILTDRPDDIAGVETELPTRENCLECMKILVEGTKKHDSLFFFYSGPGKQVRDEDGDEEDGFDECIVTSDNKLIVDDEMWEIMVKPLGRLVRLTAVMDSSCSESALDLPFTHTISGFQGSRGPKKGTMLASMVHNVLTLKPKAALRQGKQLRGKKKKPDRFNDEGGEAILFGGCRDDQVAGGFVQDLGHMTYSFIEASKKVLKKRGTLTELNLEIARIMRSRTSIQTPQLTASHPFDPESKFRI